MTTIILEFHAVQIWISDCSRSRLKKCCSIWRFRQMLTGSQQQPFSSKRSEPRVYHVRCSRSDGIIGSIRFCLFLEHLSHFSQPSLRTVCFSPGHQTDCFARSLHSVIPLCPSWIFPSIVFCLATGITRRLPLCSNPF